MLRILRYVEHRSSEGSYVVSASQGLGVDIQDQLEVEIASWRLGRRTVEVSKVQSSIRVVRFWVGKSTDYYTFFVVKDNGNKT